MKQNLVSSFGAIFAAMGTLHLKGGLTIVDPARSVGHKMFSPMDVSTSTYQHGVPWETQIPGLYVINLN
jgi:hypothetical protein